MRITATQLAIGTLLLVYRAVGSWFTGLIAIVALSPSMTAVIKTIEQYID